MSPKAVMTVPDIQVSVHTLTASTRKLKARWTVEAAKDLTNFHLGHRTRAKTVEETNKLFQLAFKFSEMFPVGSIIHLDENRVLGLPKAGGGNLMPVHMTSEAVVLIDKGSVAFLCSESKDDGDFYFVDDTFEYELVKKELEG